MLGRSARIRPKVIDLNLVPLELRQPLINNHVLLLVAAIAAAVVLFLTIDFLQSKTLTQTWDVEEQVRAARSLSRSETDRIAAESAEVAKLEQEIKRLKEATARFSTSPPVRTRRLVSLAPAVDTALAGQAASLRLTALSWQEPKLILQGRASTAQAVFTYAGQLRDSKRFAQVDLRTLSPQADKEQPASRPGAATATPTPRPAGSELNFTLELEVPWEGSR